MDKQEILNQTNGGLNVFERFIQGFPGPNKAFLNPFYEDKNASTYVFKDIDQSIYKFIDFGNDTYHGDCFTYVSLVFGKDCSNNNDFKWILNTISSELSLSLNSDDQTTPSGKLTRKTEVISTETIIPYTPPETKPYSPKELAFWMGYGITESILKRYNVCSISSILLYKKTPPHDVYSMDASMSNPIFGYVFPAYTKLYRPYGDKRSRFRYAGNKPKDAAFGIEQLPKKGNIVFMAAGEKDVLSLAARGFYAICCNSETAPIPEKIIDKLRFRFKHIFLIYDVDETGLQSMEKRLRELSKYQVKSIRLPLKGTPEEKDVSDYFKLGHTSEDIDRLVIEALKNYHSPVMTMLKSFELDYTTPPPKVKPVISINDITIGSSGNLMAITGPEGTGKSNFLGAVLAGTLDTTRSGFDTLGTQVLPNTENHAVLYYDTEQSDEQLFKNAQRIIKRSHHNQMPTWMKTYGLVGMERKDRLNSIIHSMDYYYYNYGGIHMVVIDGIADLLKGVNDEDSSVKLVDEIFRLAGIYNTCIVVVLHLSPSGYKLRGHLGSEIQRKAAGIISIEKDHNPSHSIIKALKVRSGNPVDVPQNIIHWNEDLGLHVLLGEKPATSYGDKKLNELKGIATVLFSQRPQIAYKHLVESLANECQVSSSSGEKYVKALRDIGFITSMYGENGVYRLAD